MTTKCPDRKAADRHARSDRRASFSLVELVIVVVIIGIVAAGNTTMSHFLLGLMPCNIRLEPYVPTATSYPQVLARDLGLKAHPQALVEVMPGVASYVGGDIVAGVLASGLAWFFCRNISRITCVIYATNRGN